MDKNATNHKTEKAKVQKQNEDLPNLPASSEKIKSGDTIKKQVKKTSELHQDGKTDNTDKNNEN